MVSLFVFTAIIACITLRMIIHFFEKGMSVDQLICTLFFLALTLLLAGYLAGELHIPFLDILIRG